MNMRDKKMNMHKLLEAHGYNPFALQAYELVGERDKYGLIKDLDVVLFAPGLNTALTNYFRYIQGVTPNIHKIYDLPLGCRVNLLPMIYEDPQFKNRFDFMLEKGLIIGPGDERKAYSMIVHFYRKEINPNVVKNSIDKVIVKVERRICGAKQADIRIHDDKYCSVIQ